jgi:hypothetical protein
VYDYRTTLTKEELQFVWNYVNEKKWE